MKKLAVLSLLLMSCQAFALEPFEADNGRYGFRDANRKVVIPPTFHLASEFSPDGIAWVAADDGLFWIDRTGRRLARAFNYDNGADPFVEGRARIVENDLMGFIDQRGKVVVKPRFRFLAPLENGRARFCDGCSKVEDGEHYRFEGGRWGYIDADGKVVEEAK